MAYRIGRNIGWTWDNGADRDNGQCLIIYGSQDDLNRAASYLLTYALRWPDPELSISALNKNVRYDEELRQVCLSIGTQLLGIPGDCEGTENVANNCCQPSITDVLNAQTYNTNTANTYTTNINQYGVDGLNTIAPNMVALNTSQDAVNEIMCIGVRMLVRAIVNQANAIKTGNAAQQTSLTSGLATAFGSLSSAGFAAITVGGPAAALVSFLGGPWMLLGLALAGVGLTVASLISSVSADTFTDEDAITDVICEIYDNIKDGDPTYDRVSVALDSETFADGTNADKLAAIVRPYLKNMEMYVQFMVSMSELHNAWTWPDGGVDCSCDEPVDPNCEDLTIDDYQWIAADAGNNPNPGYGVYIPGEGAAPNQTLLGYFWVRQLPGGIADSITIEFNQAVTNVQIGLLNYAGLLTYTGTPQMSFTIDVSNAPSVHPYNLDAYLLYVTFTGNAAPNAGVRMVQSCIVPYVAP